MSIDQSGFGKIAAKNMVIEVTDKNPLIRLANYRENELVDRRAGIKPLIGHAKNRSQLSKSRMKSDRTLNHLGLLQY